MKTRPLIVSAVLVLAGAVVFASLYFSGPHESAVTSTPLSTAARFSNQTAPILAKSTVAVPPIAMSAAGVLPHDLSFLVPAGAADVRTNALTYGAGETGFLVSFDASQSFVPLFLSFTQRFTPSSAWTPLASAHDDVFGFIDAKSQRYDAHVEFTFITLSRTHINIYLIATP